MNVVVPVAAVLALFLAAWILLLLWHLSSGYDLVLAQLIQLTEEIHKIGSTGSPGRAKNPREKAC